jgi:transposase
MNLIELSIYLRDEQAAENYLYEQGILKRYTECPYCGSNKLGQLSRNRIKCYICKKEWHKRKGSFLEGKHISSGLMIGIIKLFSDGVGISSIANELDLDIKTVIYIVPKLRQYFIDTDLLKSMGELKSFNIVSFSNRIQIEFPNSTIKKSKIDIFATVEIVKVRLPDKSFTYKTKLIWKDICKSSEWNSIHRFANYLQSKLINYRGLGQKSFNEYLLELITRFNTNEKNFFELLIEKLKNKGG